MERYYWLKIRERYVLEIYSIIWLGKKTGVYLPGETRGLVRNPSNITAIDNAVMSFGQGISVTSLQMAVAVSTIANYGVYVQPRIVKHQTDHDNLTLSNPSLFRQHRVVSTTTARNVLDVMEQVVVDGSGRYAAVSGYRIQENWNCSETTGQWVGL